ncbi:60S ribosomal protein L21-1 [Pyrus ussuriensis x Pyrus communis]|uniref:60S ribosomal protein L21-1 n=1 Tax=Pyrus ussuriensis x Pyrus communis TaxID=2448454 RepID=A0A5N5GAY2_9ROSA|nr:60S ribosomal protein L21-1 [Pyrus ussuriensis x Pyrus communis]
MAFGKKGYIRLSTYLETYKIGDHVDIKVNGAVHKGMPHKFYHGRTGRVWNVTKRTVGVEINKQVGNRIIRKMIHVCTEEFRIMKIKNDQLKAEAKAKGEFINTEEFTCCRRDCLDLCLMIYVRLSSTILCRM